MSKRYRFALAQVLRVRRIEEDQAAGELARARAEAVAAATHHDARRTALCGLRAPGGTVAVSRFLAWQAQVGLAGDALRAAAAAQAAAAAAMEERRADYTEAAGKVSALERLDERRRDDHRRQSLKEEAALLDDLVMARRPRAGER